MSFWARMNAKIWLVRIGRGSHVWYGKQWSASTVAFVRDSEWIEARKKFAPEELPASNALHVKKLCARDAPRLPAHTCLSWHPVTNIIDASDWVLRWTFGEHVHSLAVLLPWLESRCSRPMAIFHIFPALLHPSNIHAAPRLVVLSLHNACLTNCMIQKCSTNVDSVFFAAGDCRCGQSLIVWGIKGALHLLRWASLANLCTVRVAVQ